MFQNVNQTNQKQALNSKLFYYIQTQNLEGVENQLREGADVNALGDYHETPLIIAAFTGNVQIAKALVHAGADINAKDEDGFTPLLCAVKNSHVRLAKALINLGADLDATDPFGNTAYQLAQDMWLSDLAVFIEAKIIANNVKADLARNPKESSDLSLLVDRIRMMRSKRKGTQEED